MCRIANGDDDTGVMPLFIASTVSVSAAIAGIAINSKATNKPIMNSFFIFSLLFLIHETAGF